MKPLIIANWKCNPATALEAKNLYSAVVEGVKNIKEAETVICPPFIYIESLAGTPNIEMGAQDCFWEALGAYTGEISPQMIEDLGCKYVIVGHSERRRYFFETDETVNKKIKALLQTKLIPVFCIGETQKERESGKSEVIIRNQIIFGLKNIPGAKIANRLVVAYEPVWAIGSGNPCDVKEAGKTGQLILKVIEEIYNSDVSRKIKVLYGGSVNSKNAGDYIKKGKLRGLLVGGSSLKAEEFVALVKKTV